MRLLLIASLALLVALAAGVMFNPVNQAASSDDPAGGITAMTVKSPALGEAIAAADRGDTTRLIDWLKQAEPVERIRFAVLHNRMMELSGGRDAKGVPLTPDDRALYRLRWRYSAMSAVSLEDARLNLMVDNSLAYGLVAGTARPTPRDIELARSLLPRLEAATERDPSPSVSDTIGCVHFAAGAWEASAKAFAAAIDLTAKSGRPADETKGELDFYRKRLEAAKYNQAVIAGTRPAPLRPLPLTFTETPKP